MFRIGEFSRLSQVSVKALRHYDHMGLLKPAQVDPFTGYRYYSVDQLPRLNRILALKGLGLSLEQISRLLEKGLPADQLRGMLRLKQAEIEQQVADGQARLARVAARLRQIEQEDAMPQHDVVLKEIAVQRVAALRDVIPTYSEQGLLWEEVGAYLARRGLKPTGPCFAIYYDEEYRERDVDTEACEPVDAPLDEEGRVKVRDLCAVAQMASLVHRGSFEGLNEAYGALMAWVQASGYRIIGPNREIYLRGPADGVEPADYLTEIQFPVATA